MFESRLISKLLIELLKTIAFNLLKSFDEKATSWNAFAGDIVVKSRDTIKLHQEKYNVNSVIPHNVLASDYLTDCHQALFFQQDTLVY